MKRIVLSVGIAAIIMVSPASAQWIYQLKESAFDDEKTDDASPINALKPQLMVRIDKNKVHAIEAETDVVDNKLRIVAELSGGIVEEIRDAKQRVAVVLSVIGQNFHENSFNVRGSTNAAKKLITTCK